MIYDKDAALKKTIATHPEYFASTKVDYKRSYLSLKKFKEMNPEKVKAHRAVSSAFRSTVAV